MTKYLFPNFLRDSAEYDQAVQFWQEQWQGLIVRLGEEAFWESPWLGTTFADGSPCRDGNPIFSAVSSSRQLGIRIIQVEPEANPRELAFWTDQIGESEESIRELAIACVLTNENVNVALDLMTQWIATGELEIGLEKKETGNLLTALAGVSAELSKVGDPEFAETSVVNTSTVTIFLQRIHDPLLGNLLNPPVFPVTKISAKIHGVEVTLQSGLALSVGKTLTVTVTRIVQVADPNPTVGATTYVFSANQDGSGPTIETASTYSISLFQPSIMIKLAVNKSRATIGSTITYTVTISNTSSANSPNLVFVPGSFSATVSPPVGFVLPTWLTAAAGIAPGYSNSFTYTNVVNDTPNPLANTVDIHFHPQSFGCHILTNDIHGPSNTVNTQIFPAAEDPWPRNGI